VLISEILGYNTFMPRQTTGGFVGYILLTIIAVGVGVASYLMYERETPESSQVVSDKKETISDNESQLAGVVSVEEASKATTTKEVKDETVSKTVFDTVLKTVKKENVVANNSDSQESKPVEVFAPTPTPAPEISEPTLLVEAGEQPKSTVVPADADRVPFTVVNLTALGSDITVDSLEVERKGFASDRVFYDVGIEGIDSERVLNANHKYATHKPFTIMEGESQEVLIFGNINAIATLADYNGQTPQLALSAIEISSKTPAKISGTLPVVGAMHTVTSNVTIGSLELTSSGTDPATNKTVYINDKNITFSAVRLTAGSAENVLLKSFAWLQAGSVSSLDLANVKICVDYKVVKCFDAELDDRYYYFELEDEIKIDKGDSADVYIKGDVLPSGVSRTVDFNVDSSYDILGYGLSYRHNFYSYYGGEEEGEQAEGVFSLSEIPIYNAYAHTISGGSFNSIGR